MQLHLLWTKVVYVTVACRVNVLTGFEIQCFNFKYKEQSTEIRTPVFALRKCVDLYVIIIIIIIIIITI